MLLLFVDYRLLLALLAVLAVGVHVRARRGVMSPDFVLRLGAATAVLLGMAEYFAMRAVLGSVAGGAPDRAATAVPLFTITAVMLGAMAYAGVAFGSAMMLSRRFRPLGWPTHVVTMVFAIGVAVPLGMALAGGLVSLGHGTASLDLVHAVR